jgi:hypothetical protein
VKTDLTEERYWRFIYAEKQNSNELGNMALSLFPSIRFNEIVRPRLDLPELLCPVPAPRVR